MGPLIFFSLYEEESESSVEELEFRTHLMLGTTPTLSLPSYWVKRD